MEQDPEKWWKQQRHLHNGETARWQGIAALPPTSVGAGDGDGRRPGGKSSLMRWLKGLLIQTGVAIIVFIVVWGYFEWELPGSDQARQALQAALSADMDFKAIEAWYSDTFDGSPFLLPLNLQREQTRTGRALPVLLSSGSVHVPVQGAITRRYSPQANEMIIAAASGSAVRSIYSGKVQQVVQSAEGAITIIVQHPNRVLSVYGNMASAVVKTNDWVEAGDLIGTLGGLGGADGREADLLFSVHYNGRPIDPLDVVPFD